MWESGRYSDVESARQPAIGVSSARPRRRALLGRQSEMLRAMLGDTRYRQWQDYQQTRSQRMQVDAYAAAVLLASQAVAQTAGDAAAGQVASAMQALSDVRVPVTVTFVTSGKLPGSYQQAGMEGPVRLPHATLSLSDGGIITIEFNDKADPLLRGRMLRAVPMAGETGDLYFYCLAPALPAALRPKGCLAAPGRE